MLVLQSLFYGVSLNRWLRIIKNPRRNLGCGGGNLHLESVKWSAVYRFMIRMVLTSISVRAVTR